LLRWESIWFPELLDLYLGDQDEALLFMYEEEQTPLPLDVVSVITQFHYSVMDFKTKRCLID